MSELAFDRTRIDTLQRLLLLDDQPVELQPLVFDMLCFLARHPRRAIARSELLAAVWRSPHVSDSVVARAMMKARRAIQDDAASPRLLRTVNRVGYRLDADVIERPSAAGPSLPAPALPTSQGRLALAILPFENTIVDASLGWMSQGLMGLLHHLLQRPGGLALLPVVDVNRVCAGLPVTMDLMAHACASLGAAEAVYCRIARHDLGFSLQARRGRTAAAAVEWSFSGVDAIQLVVALAKALCSDALLATYADADTFWHEQFAQTLDLHQTGQHARALALFQACQPHLPETHQLRLLHARLLQACGQLDAAMAQIEQALAQLGNDRGGMDQVGLLGLLAQCEYEADRLAPSARHFEQALQLTESLPEAAALRPPMLSSAASVATRQADPVRAIRLAEAAVAEADRLGHPDLQTRAWLVLAAILDQLDQAERATGAVQHAIQLAHQSGVVEYGARAWRLMSNVQNGRRHHRKALQSVARSIVLWIRCGNVAMLLWARLMELVILIESDHVEPAQAAIARLTDHEGVQPAHVDTLKLLVAILDWRLGQADASFAALHQLTEGDRPEPTITQMLAHTELAFMYAHRGDVARTGTAVAGMAGMPTVGAPERCRAAQALAAGQRPLAIELLWGLWRSNRVCGLEGLNIVIDLTWLLLEDAPSQFDDAHLETLFAHVLDMSDERLDTQMLRAGYLLRQKPGAHSKAQWDRVIAGARPLQLRCPGLLTPAYRDALAQGSPPRQRELLTRICW